MNQRLESFTKIQIQIHLNRKIQLPPLISGYVSHSIAPESSSNGPTKSTATPEEEERSSPRSSAYTNMITTTMTSGGATCNETGATEPNNI
ncbi:hypothetical protein YC2023_076065 [Brassica napus]